MKGFKVLNSITMTATEVIQLEHDFLLNIHQHFKSQDFTNQQVARLLQLQLIFSSDLFLINYCDWLIDYCWPMTREKTVVSMGMVLGSFLHTDHWMDWLNWTKQSWFVSYTNTVQLYTQATPLYTCTVSISVHLTYDLS